MNVYYYVVPEIVTNDFMDTICFGEVDKEKMDETHLMVHSEQIEVLDKDEFLSQQFSRFNGEDNPLSTTDNQDYIRANSLHTSMRVGDVISYTFQGKPCMSVCKPYGWEELI